VTVSEAESSTRKKEKKEEEGTQTHEKIHKMGAGRQPGRNTMNCGRRKNNSEKGTEAELKQLSKGHQQFSAKGRRCGKNARTMR